MVPVGSDKSIFEKRFKLYPTNLERLSFISSYSSPKICPLGRDS